MIAAPFDAGVVTTGPVTAAEYEALNAEYRHLKMELEVYREQHDWLSTEVLNLNHENRTLACENDLLKWYATFFDTGRTDAFLRPLLDKLVLAYKLRVPDDAPLIAKHFP